MTLASAGNTLAPSLGVLRSLGYHVTRDRTGIRSYRAEDDTRVFIAEDPLSLLGLVKLYECRGDDWRPSDAEVDDFISMEEDR